jgi:hypothetical protein
MTWHDETHVPVYAAGERQAELEARGEAPWQKLREARLRRPFTREDLTTVRVWMGVGRYEISRVVNIDEAGCVLVPTSIGLSWFNPRNVERGRVVATWEPEE